MQKQIIKKEIRERLEQLRGLYFRATPSQRFKMATDRLKYPESGSNRLIQCVSAVEGFARSVALDSEVKTGTPVDQAYGSLRYVGPMALIEDHIAGRIGSSPEVIFGLDDWELFSLAVEYRNFLVHEAASLRQGYSNELIEACKRVLEKLAETAGVRI